jgi:hypothetical protein
MALEGERQGLNNFWQLFINLGNPLGFQPAISPPP